MLALRGAITVDEDRAEAVDDSVESLMERLYSENSISDDDVEFAIFSQTKDIRSRNAAAAARKAGFLKRNAIFCVEEADVELSLPLCIRVLVYTKKDGEPKMVYLKGASLLRPDFRD